MTAPASPDQRSRARRQLVVGTVLVVVLVILGATVTYLATRESSSADDAAADPPAAGFPSVTTPPDVTWEPAVGVDLPISRLHGPRTVDALTASGFSESEFGAALAAAHVLIRSSANAGPAVYESTITQQVVGANAAAMKLNADRQYEQLQATAGVPDGEPAPTADAEVVGYRVAAFDPSAGSATIEVYLTSQALQATEQLVRFDVTLQRSDDDWKVVAPPRGDWSAVATTLSQEPAGLLSYDEST